MPKKYCKKYAKYMQKYKKIPPKPIPKTMVNPRDSGTLEVLFFVKSITLKCFFHMIKGARNTSKIYKKSMSNPTCEKVSQKHEKGIQNGAQNP